MVLSLVRRLPFPAIAVAALAAACSEPAARVTLVPLGGACGQPLGANLVKVTAYAASGERSTTLAIDEAVAIADFPADTEQIGVEVIIGGGATGAAGKSAPLPFGGLPDGATIPVFMAPPDGFCEVGAMTEARGQPLVARAGDGVLVLGGTGAAGALSSAEYYDPATATFSPIEVPQVLAGDPQGFTGAALATLPDGRVAVVGGPQSAFVVFDPEARAFATDPVLIESRAFHAAIASGEADVLVAGGCFKVEAGKCAGVQRGQVLRYPLDHISTPDRDLPTTNGARVGAQLFDLGVQLDGSRQFLLAGGAGEPGSADRFALERGPATRLSGGHAQPAALDGGAVLVAFGDDEPASAPDGAAAVFAPGALAAQPIARAPDVQGARLIALEDGRVAGFGGDAMGRVMTYDPTRGTWSASLAGSADQPGALVRPSLARLPDGSVLVLGGAVSPRAWLYRPSLVGPASGAVTAVPASEIGRGVLTAPDPGTLTRSQLQPPAWVLRSPGEALTARALVGGPRTATGSVGAIVHVRGGGVALIAQQTAPGQAIVAELAPGQPPRLVQLDGGQVRGVCSQPPALAAFDPAVAVSLRLAIRDRVARLSIDQREVLACELAASARGAWGLAALGAGAEVAVNSVNVAR